MTDNSLIRQINFFGFAGLSVILLLTQIVGYIWSINRGLYLAWTFLMLYAIAYAVLTALANCPQEVISKKVRSAVGWYETHLSCAIFHWCAVPLFITLCRLSLLWHHFEKRAWVVGVPLILATVGVAAMAIIETVQILTDQPVNKPDDNIPDDATPKKKSTGEVSNSEE
jgi:predicted outer membrane lipoprotein